MLELEIQNWIKNKFKELTLPQKLAIPKILSGKSVLICSPTGSGKTLAAFIPIFNELLKFYKNNNLNDKIYCIYVSPLRSLNNDIEKNLKKYVEELNLPIRISIRTSDTPPHKKSEMLKKPPHILITTPESLNIALSSRKFKEFLKPKWVVIDEVHALAENKRGTLLSICLERLNPEIRIGLSATISPLEEIAKFLKVDEIIDVSLEKKFKVKLIPIENPEKEEIYKKIYKIIKKHKSVLIFTNTRSSTEAVVHYLKEKFKFHSAAHHSSLSREVRLEVEEKLRKGELKVCVSSTSLELGIDIGHIEAVILLSSPKSVIRAIQRIGRSGHSLKDTSIGYLIGVSPNDLLELEAIKKFIEKRKLDKIRIPKGCLDILAQQIIGMSYDELPIKEVYEIIKRAYPYRELSYKEFEEILKFLENIGKIEIKYGKIKPKFPLHLYFLNSGAIIDEPKIRVIEKRFIGYVEEEFAEMLVPGDVFVLGGKTYKFLKKVRDKIFVKEVKNVEPNIPVWFSEMLPLTYDLARYIEKIRYKKAVTTKFLKNYLKMQDYIPSPEDLLIEIWYDHNWKICFHTLCGRRANEAISKVFGYILGKTYNCNVNLKISDFGFIISLPKKVLKIDIMNLLKIDENVFLKILEDAILESELFKKRFKDVCQRFLIILRKDPRKNISEDSIYRQAERLIEYVNKNSPLVRETLREILYDKMHVDEAIEYLKGKKNVIIREKCSPFSFVIDQLSITDLLQIKSKKEVIKEFFEKIKYLTE